MGKTGIAILSVVGILLMVIVLVLAVVVIYGIVTYNFFVSKEESIRNAWAQVENQFQRRYDLIPNLVASVKGYAQHEREVFEHVADARAKLAGAKTTQEKIDAANELEGALARLLVIVERYPELRASETFIRLMDELAGTENRLAVERMRYNDQVRDFNQRARRFPSNIIAGIFGFQKHPFFEAPAPAKEAPKVQF